jgi:glucosamine--fructose-6-phosphate aminotransferase (isomerizing)
VFVATVDHIYEKTQSNIEEVKARKGPIIAIPMEGNDALAKKVDDIISVSRSLDSSLTTSLLPRPRRGQT